MSLHCRASRSCWRKVEGKTGRVSVSFDHSYINLAWELAFSGAGYRTMTSLRHISPRALESRSVYTRTSLPYSAIAAARTSGKSSNSDTVSGVGEFRKACSSTKYISRCEWILLPLLLLLSYPREMPLSNLPPTALPYHLVNADSKKPDHCRS